MLSSEDPASLQISRLHVGRWEGIYLLAAKIQINTCSCLSESAGKTSLTPDYKLWGQK